jgi:uncharacterized protein YkwD
VWGVALVAAGWACSSGADPDATPNTPEEAVDWWMNSDTHCANIMGPNYTLLGVGYYAGDGEWGQYWTQNFGSD